MMNDTEFMNMIEVAVKNYKGQIDDLGEVIGMLNVGRLMGWKVARLVYSKRCWSNAIKTFGDPKAFLPAEGVYYRKSLGMRVIDEVGGYWDYIKGKQAAMPLHDRKMMM